MKDRASPTNVGRAAPPEAVRSSASPTNVGRAAPPSWVDEPPPFWSTWGWIYAVVAIALAVETLAFWLLGRWAGR
jgi:hypothetical protein